MWEEPLRPCRGGGHRLVLEQPAPADQGPACPTERNDAGPLRLLRRIRQLSTIELVCRRSREHLEEMAVATGSPQTVPVEPVHGAPEAIFSSSASDRPSLHRCERTLSVKNRMLEFCTSGSARGEGGNVLTYSATRAA